MYAFNLKNAQFDYEPYPICYIPQFFSDVDYKALTESYPKINESFKHKGYLGNKYSLSELNNPDAYFEYVNSHPEWKKFFDHVKSKKFVEDMFAFLTEHGVDLGFKEFDFTPNRKAKPRRFLVPKNPKPLITTRFEYSVLKANGGDVVPHTDAPNKIITIVLSFTGNNEWNEKWGGGTDVVLPKDRSKVYNHMNKQFGFDDVDIIKTFPFVENQGVVFIKTYNSWHSVSPMTGPETGLRKTVTINIEKIV